MNFKSACTACVTQFEYLVVGHFYGGVHKDTLFVLFSYFASGKVFCVYFVIPYRAEKKDYKRLFSIELSCNISHSRIHMQAPAKSHK